MYEEKPSTEMARIRQVSYSVHPLLLNRWSPRSMTGETMTDEELLPLFEAARLAPSSYNNQPWRFLLARRDSAHWDLFYNLLIPFNKEWTKNAAALIVVISKNNFEQSGKLSRTHSYDTGAAWMSLALEGTGQGYVVHGMEGFDYEKARKDLKVPDEYTVEAMAAIGKRAPKEKLSPELQKREEPSTRKSLRDILIEGTF